MSASESSSSEPSSFTESPYPNEAEVVASNFQSNSSSGPKEEETGGVGENNRNNVQWAHLFHPNEKGTRKQKRCDHDGAHRKKRTNPMVDFDRLGSKAWGERLLFEALAHSEIDTLVGFAHSCSAAAVSKQNEQEQNVDDSEPGTPVHHDPKQFDPLRNISFDAPLPPSHIGYIRSRALIHQGRDRKNTSQKTAETDDASALDDSAGVAMGMYLEEALTASLLPFAGMHVLRCRALEAMESAETEYGIGPYALQPTVLHPITGEAVRLDMKHRIRWKEETSFEEWTLPPEEAILKLMEQGMLSKETPYHFIPHASRSWTPPKFTRKNSAESEDDSYELAQHHDMGTVSANKEIFDIFTTKSHAAHGNL